MSGPARLDAAEVVRLIRADPDAYAEAFLVCAGTLWHRGDVTGLVKAEDMLIANAGASVPSPAALEGEGRAAAAAACGRALRGMLVSRAAREHGLYGPGTLTGKVLAAALDGVEWDAVGNKFLAATLTRLDHQTRQAAAQAVPA
jgi:hypothetical protein